MQTNNLWVSVWTLALLSPLKHLNHFAKVFDSIFSVIYFCIKLHKKKKVRDLNAEQTSDDFLLTPAE